MVERLWSLALGVYEFLEGLVQGIYRGCYCTSSQEGLGLRVRGLGWGFRV